MSQRAYKNQKKIPIGSIIEIVWADAYSPNQGGWTEAEEYLNDELGNTLLVRSVGYVLGVDENYIAISGCKYDDALDIVKMVSRMIRIPFGVVTEYHVLKPKK
jgi:hypothetical protein